ncbi:unnamed protein product [Mesocestoides corti]|uniref:BRCT domain-containing protein n=1 Tax=Mesocestoides corti TaxID=53468 RepID=A0A0R3U9K5_MESCO|nr:unnamed protein product [Mesocestoides corti]
MGSKLSKSPSSQRKSLRHGLQGRSKLQKADADNLVDTVTVEPDRPHKEGDCVPVSGDCNAEGNTSTSKCTKNAENHGLHNSAINVQPQERLVEARPASIHHETSSEESHVPAEKSSAPGCAVLTGRDPKRPERAWSPGMDSAVDLSFEMQNFRRNGELTSSQRQSRHHGSRSPEAGPLSDSEMEENKKGRFECHFWVPLTSLHVFDDSRDRRLKSIARSSGCSITLTNSTKLDLYGVAKRKVLIKAVSTYGMAKCKNLIDAKFPEFIVRNAVVTPEVAETPKIT